MASNRYFVLGQTSHVHGPHPSFLTSAHGCTRFVPENLPPTLALEKRQKPNATVCIQLCEGTVLESTSLLRRKNSLPYQARGSRAGAVRCPPPTKT